MQTLDQILGPTLLAQCRQVPEPEDLRGHVLAKLNVWVPITAPSVLEWLTEHFKAPPATAAAVPPVRIEVECTESGREYGSCSYRVSYTGTGTISITEAELRQMIRDAGSREEAIEAFVRWADDNHEVDDCDNDGFRYDDYERSDREREDYGHNAVSVIEDYLDRHPELLPDEDEDEYSPPPGGDNQTQPMPAPGN